MERVHFEKRLKRARRELAPDSFVEHVRGATNQQALDVVEAFIELGLGADAIETGPRRRSVLMAALGMAGRDRYPRLVAYLLERGADPARADADGWTPACYGARLSHSGPRPADNLVASLQPLLAHPSLPADDRALLAPARSAFAPAFRLLARALVAARPELAGKLGAPATPAAIEAAQAALGVALPEEVQGLVETFDGAPRYTYHQQWQFLSLAEIVESHAALRARAIGFDAGARRRTMTWPAAMLPLLRDPAGDLLCVHPTLLPGHKTAVPGHLPAYVYLHDEDRFTPGPYRFGGLMERLWEGLPQPAIR